MQCKEKKTNVPSNIDPSKRIIKKIQKTIEPNNGKNQAQSSHKNRVCRKNVVSKNIYRNNI